MYSPKIREDLIPILYRLSKEHGKPMTRVVDDILRGYLTLQNDLPDSENEGLLEKLAIHNFQNDYSSKYYD